MDKQEDDQRRKIEVLELKLEEARTGRQRVDLMLELAMRLRPRDIARARQYAREALERAKKIDYNYGVAVAYLRRSDCERMAGEYRQAIRDLGRAEQLLTVEPEGARFLPELHRTKGALLFSVGHIDEAIESLDRALPLYRERDDRVNVATTLAFMGDAYRELGDLAHALVLLEESLRLAEEVGPPEGVALALSNIACIYGDLDDMKTSLEFASRARDIYQRTGNLNAEAKSWRLIGMCFLVLGEIDAAWEGFDRARRLFLQFDARADMAECAAQLAEIEMGRGRYAESERLIEEAIVAAREAESPSVLAMTLCSRARIYLGSGRPDRVAELLCEAITLGESIRSHALLIDVYDILSIACEQTGDFAGALNCFTRIRLLQRDHDRQQAWRMAAQLEMRRRLSTLEAERALADEQIAELAAQVERRESEIAALSLRLAQRDDLVAKLRDDVKRHGRDASGNAAELVRILTERLGSGADDAVGWEAFEERFTALQSGFLRTLAGRCPELTAAELKICVYLHTGLSNKEIATITCSSIHTVNTHRRNIRRKLRMETGTSLDVILAGLLN